MNQPLSMENCQNANLAPEIVEFAKTEIVPIVVKVSGRSMALASNSANYHAKNVSKRNLPHALLALGDSCWKVNNVSPISHATKQQIVQTAQSVST